MNLKKMLCLCGFAILLFFVAVGALLAYMTTQMPTIDDAKASALIYSNFCQIASVNVLTNKQTVKILNSSRHQKTFLFVTADLSEEEKQKLRMLAEQVEQNYELDTGKTNNVRLEFR